MKPLFPLFLKLAGRPVLVIGGGRVALRRLERLLEAGARVTLVAPSVLPAIKAHGAAGRLLWRRGEFEPGDLEGVDLAFLAAGDPQLVERVAAEAARRGVPLNCAEEEERCDFHVPAVIDRGGLRIALSSGGASPALLKRLREGLEAWLERQDLGGFEELRERRRALRAEHGDPEARTAALEELAAERLAPGKVYLVGAGPGDPGLLTVRAFELLRSADVVYHDRLVSDEVLAVVPESTPRVYVGKEVGCAHRANIGRLLIEAARAGKRVVRLKGGDPMLFGRGGEEVLELIQAGVDYELVPGVSALCSVPEAAGIPVTFRGVASELVVRSGHRVAEPGAPPKPRPPGSPETTFVYFMAAGRLPEVAAELLAEGVDPATPVAIIQKGTLPGQRVLTGELGGLAALARRESIEPPALVVAGKVVKFREPREFLSLVPVVEAVNEVARAADG
jgi:uroporphyrin-III C-methyltransferase/precorrin-2 dehydrogenase/sirohydrochlorin ferrochelatase